MARIAAIFLFCKTTDGVDRRTDFFRSLAAYEDGFRMLGAEFSPRLGSAGSEKQGRALRTRFAQMRSRDLEIVSFVMNLPHPLRDRILPFLHIADDGIITPTAFPELIHCIHILVRDPIGLIVVHLRVETEIPR